MANDFNQRFLELLNTNRFKKLTKTYTDYVPYQFVNFNEMDHSRFIAWVLNPREGHGAGNFFFKRFIKALKDENPKSKYLSNLPKLSDASDFLYKLEWEIKEGNGRKSKSGKDRSTQNDDDPKKQKPKNGRLDIFAIRTDGNYAFIIENKIKNSFTDNQLKRYYEFSRDKKKSPKDNCLIVMDLSDSVRKKISIDHPDWLVLSYEWLGAALEKYLSKFDPRTFTHLSKTEIEGVRAILSGYLYEIEGYLSDEFHSGYYRNATDVIRNLGCEYHDLWAHKRFEKLWNISSPLDEAAKKIMGKAKKAETQEILKNMFEYEELFSELSEYGFLHKMERELEKLGYSVNVKSKGASHLYYTDKRICENEAKLFPRSGNDYWAISLQATLCLESKVYTFKLIDKVTKSSKGRPSEYDAIKIFLKDNKQLINLRKEIKNHKPVSKEDLLTASKSMGKMLKSIVSDYIKSTEK